MAIVDKAGTVNNLSSVDTPNSNKAEGLTSGGKPRVVLDRADISVVGEDNGSKYRIARVPFNSVVTQITLQNSAIAGGTYSLGIYDIPEDGGVVIDDDLFLASEDFTAAGTLDGLVNIGIDDKHKKLYELAGLSEDPSKLVDVVLTAVAVGTGPGTASIHLEYTLD